MNGLKPIDAWVSNLQFHKGEYRDRNGNGLCGTWLREYKKTYEIMILDSGEVQGKYKYPKDVKISFRSEMVSWQNLYLCGSYNIIERENCYIHINNRIVEAVCNGSKPVGFVLLNNMSILDGYVNQICKAKIYSSIQFHPLKESLDGYNSEDTFRGYFILGMANEGKVGEVFNLERYAGTYRDFARISGINIEEGLKFVLSRSDMELSELIKDGGSGYKYDYANPSNIGELMFTGLTLGYPIESTIAMLYCNRF
ncbi:hypothetical protein ACJDU8_01875 [Clostridium sp. WILCCON 0269]|uniref:Uncharacterized protein n=1 Tax=Candidatus Clostridium eludens TaxID=3381663 RepID=A0ABW8SFM4_9CLOT